MWTKSHKPALLLVSSGELPTQKLSNRSGSFLCVACAIASIQYSFGSVIGQAIDVYAMA
jgi:hypothetical protein